MKIRIISLCVALFAAIFCAAVLLSPAVAGAEEANYSHIKATVVAQFPKEDAKGFYYETEVITRYGNILRYKETDKLYRGCPLLLEVYTPDNNVSHWIITNVNYQLTIERAFVYILLSAIPFIIAKM